MSARRFLWAVAVVAAVLVGLLPATAHTRSTQPASPTDLRAAGERALELISYPAARVGYRVVFEGGRRGVRGRIDTQRKSITVFLRADDAPHRVAHDVAHELGHAYDQRFMTDALRHRYLIARGVAGGRWWPQDGQADYRSGAGDFAEVFALCHAASPEFRSQLGGRPKDACQLLASVTSTAMEVAG